MKTPFWILIIACLTFVGCDGRNAVKNTNVVVTKESSLKFKNELESLNDSSGVKVKVHIPDDAPVIYATEEEVLALKNGIVLFGWPRCPWFRNAIEPLLEFAKEEHATIYYLNIHDIRDFKELEDGKIVTSKPGSPGYQAILKKFHEILNPYTAVGVDSVKRISSPTVLYIKDGKGVYKVVSTVASQEKPFPKLSAEQREELKQRYRKYFIDN